MEYVEICIMFKNKKRVESYSLTYLFNELYICKSFKQVFKSVHILTYI